MPDQPLTTQTITIDKTYGGDLVSVTVTVAELPSNIDCSNSDTIRIIKCDTVFSKAAVPTAFTPNGDGYDDNWKIPGLNDQYKHAIVQVYDRWGRLVYQSTAGYPDPGWDGRDANGKYAPMDNYYYIINFNQNNIPSVVGSITIIR